MTSQGAAVFLDRDGVLNRAIVRDGKPYPPESAETMEIPPEVSPALLDLKAAGFLLLVVTNQPDVAKGTQTRGAVEDIHARLRLELPLDDIFVCYHQDADHCGCRKPAPGMLTKAARRYELDLRLCYIVGDRWRDIDAGYQAGCDTVFLDRGYRERPPDSEPTVRVRSLREGVDWILAHWAQRTNQ